MSGSSSSFAFLKVYGPLYFRLAEVAEQALALDPNTTLVKTRQLSEAFARHAAARAGLIADRRDASESQLDLLRVLEQRGIVREHIAEIFHAVRRAGNRAVHDFSGSRQDALEALHLAYQLACWFHRSFGDVNARLSFKPDSYRPPDDPSERLRQLEEAAAVARAEAETQKQSAAAMQKALEAEAARRTEEERARKLAEEEREVWAAIAAENEAELHKAAAEQKKTISALMAQAQKAPAQAADFVVGQSIVATSETAPDEQTTRILIDAQLRAAGWEVDTVKLRYLWGARPEKGKNRAIAEWPTFSQADGKGIADYVLFAGLTPVAVVEAKKQNKKIPSAIEQAKRYSRGFVIEGPMMQPAPAGVEPGDFAGWVASSSSSSSSTPGSARYKIPFLYATNGRPYLRQVEAESGVWFLDARKPTNHPRALSGWHSPDVLIDMLAHDPEACDDKLASEPPDVVQEAIGLRPYQVSAIRAVEEVIATGRRSILVAMATGTGKTRMVIGLIHRLLKSQRFRRVLFLVDRSSLGEQAHAAFREVRLENLQTFAQNYDVKGLEDITPARETKVHVATVQGMVRRILWSSPDDPPMPIDRYDCIIVDESHRGYTLDREMSEGEMELRGLEDYVSTYRRVLDHFDAIKIGLTATPALHTREIFGPEVYSYKYREAVADGFLVDHGAPYRIVTKLAKEGIHFEKGSEVGVLQADGAVQLSLLPDELQFEVDAFNRAVITDGFNRAVAQELAEHLDPTGEAKTIVFCVDDDHAERFVPILKEEMTKAWGVIDDGLIRKITGVVDRPLDAIRHFKNEPLPKIAVTVDLLTTGIDVPKVCNVVFLRRVRSRILYEQMLGRATRLCPEIGKEIFNIFDAVGIYDALEPVTDMKPLVKDVTVTTKQLIDELLDPRAPALPGADLGSTHADDIGRALVEKVRRLSRRIDKHGGSADVLAAVESLEGVFGCTLKALPDVLHEAGTEGLIRLLQEKPELSTLLERMSAATVSKPGAVISDKADEVLAVERGYGAGNQKPEDYLAAFEAFVAENRNTIAGLTVVCTRPSTLTKAQLKDLRLKLDLAGYSEAQLRDAWREVKQQDIAATIIGFIRQRALGSPLVSYEDRVDRAVAKIQASGAWTGPQKTWLKRIGEALKKEIVVDEEGFGQGAFANWGGWKGMDKALGGKLRSVLDELGDEVWKDAA
jgi:type I restriction enzyme R subunit